MKDEMRLQLIKGDFKIEDANDLLLELFRYKIHFHGHKLYSDYQKFGKDAANSRRRIEELKVNLAMIRDFMARAKEEGMEIEMEGMIKVKAKSPSEGKSYSGESPTMKVGI